MNIKKGYKVKLEYEGRLEDGTIFDSSIHGNHSHPLVFVVGGGQVLEAFEKKVAGMENGEEKEFALNPDEAYGEYRQELQQKIPAEMVSSEQKPRVGMVLMIEGRDGKRAAFRIIAIDVDSKAITLDLNHPLAGKKLIFKIKIVGVEKNSSKN